MIKSYLCSIEQTNYCEDFIMLFNEYQNKKCLVKIEINVIIQKQIQPTWILTIKWLNPIELS